MKSYIKKIKTFKKNGDIFLAISDFTMWMKTVEDSIVYV